MDQTSPGQVSREENGRFLPGTRPPPGAGRKPGSITKTDLLIRAGLRSAIDTLRNSVNSKGHRIPDPIKAAFNIGLWIEAQVNSRTTFQERQAQQLRDHIAALPLEEFKALLEGAEAAANIYLRLAEYAYPKLARHEHIGDAPSLAVQNAVEVTLNIGNRPRLPNIEINGGTAQQQPPTLGSGNGGGAEPASG